MGDRFSSTQEEVMNLWIFAPAIIIFAGMVGALCILSTKPEYLHRLVQAMQYGVKHCERRE
ncbi:hypothetical protein A2392_01800 [Candidatus Kaiserbacteria bacterium RIFOXYB1_FULL_46_14]|uniref:Uncharacterized protein n=1 Tax=Candidatus Kaiserbacteria bacterium RIFOXYB1_FULL_46_14 TaxID=1798531 RepID=A0A1F6FJZ5_9BACT|nr:MAG: hypothetical protein A2392_01800 [Candidatus Kaiserbacteria bacterium RIFOXYB1_FULL_46_14]